MALNVRWPCNTLTSSVQYSSPRTVCSVGPVGSCKVLLCIAWRTAVSLIGLPSCTAHHLVIPSTATTNVAVTTPGVGAANAIPLPARLSHRPNRWWVGWFRNGGWLRRQCQNCRLNGFNAVLHLWVRVTLLSPLTFGVG